MNLSSIRWPASVLAVVVAVSCAKVSAPMGGPRDKLPPVVVKSSPASRGRNVAARRIEITFDEFVVLDQVNDKFLVSPPVKKKPQVYTRGKSVIIDFEEDLKPGTTYTLSFRDAIRDLNEANILDDYQFVFSTGSVVDSLSVTGNVYESPDLEVPDKTNVLLYRNTADSAVRKSMPDYIATVDANGYFRINNVAAGVYRLYALTDEDNSRSYNLGSEKFAFADSLITVSPARNFIPELKDSVRVKTEPGRRPELLVRKGDNQLILFRAQSKAHYLASSNRELKYKLNYILSLPPDTMKFAFSTEGADPSSYYLEKSQAGDSVKVWITDSTLYNLPLINTLVTFPYTDSLGLIVSRTDTIPLRFTPPRQAGRTKPKKPVFTFDSRIRSGDLKPGEKIFFTAATPFSLPDTSKIRFYELADTLRKKKPFTLVPDPGNSCRYRLDASLNQGKQYLFVARSGAFGNIYNEKSDSIGIRFTMRNAESYNTLTFNIKGFSGKGIVQLLTKDEKIAASLQVTKEGKASFPLLDAGIYRARFIYDLNGDGKWTTGDFSLLRQPEPVTYYGQDLDLKSGMSADNTWDLTLRNFKEQLMRKKKEESR